MFAQREKEKAIKNATNTKSINFLYDKRVFENAKKLKLNVYIIAVWSGGLGKEELFPQSSPLRQLFRVESSRAQSRVESLAVCASSFLQVFFKNIFSVLPQKSTVCRCLVVLPHSASKKQSKKRSKNAGKIQFKSAFNRNRNGIIKRNATQFNVNANANAIAANARNQNENASPKASPAFESPG